MVPRVSMSTMRQSALSEVERVKHVAYPSVDLSCSFPLSSPYLQLKMLGLRCVYGSGTIVHGTQFTTILHLWFGIVVFISLYIERCTYHVYASPQFIMIKVQNVQNHTKNKNKALHLFM